jgi:hypothetical protein
MVLLLLVYEAKMEMNMSDVTYLDVVCGWIFQVLQEYHGQM